jgi:nicotinamide riboside transporter PnuC
MSEQNRISPFIRIVSGVIGVLGFAAIAFNVSQNGGVNPSIVLLASFFAGFVFLYVALFGTYPWNRTKSDE